MSNPSWIPWTFIWHQFGVDLYLTIFFSIGLNKCSMVQSNGWSWFLVPDKSISIFPLKDNFLIIILPSFSSGSYCLMRCRREYELIWGHKSLVMSQAHFRSERPDSVLHSLKGVMRSRGSYQMVTVEKGWSNPNGVPGVYHLPVGCTLYNTSPCLLWWLQSCLSSNH